MKKINEILKKYYLFFIVALLSCVITIFINSSTSMAYTPQQLYDQVWKLVNTKYVDQTNNDQSWASWRHKYDNEIKTNSSTVALLLETLFEPEKNPLWLWELKHKVLRIKHPYTISDFKKNPFIPNL